MSRFVIVFGVLLAFALLNTSLLLGLQFLEDSYSTQPVNSNSTSTPDQQEGKGVIANTPSRTVSLWQTPFFTLTVLSWFAVIGTWIWRGQIRSKWGKLGISQDTFRLLVRMKGSRNRVSLLRMLSVPKDRLQLAKDLGVDWRTVNHHIEVLHKHGLIREHASYGNVKLYELTDMGQTLLKLVEELDDSA